MKTCTKCNITQPDSEFYKRKAGGRVSWCKCCMKGHSAQVNDPQTPRTDTEMLAINALRQAGIYADTGKLYRSGHVDVIALGCIRIEVKYSDLTYRQKKLRYRFTFTPSQRKAQNFDIVMLICNHKGSISYHLFDKSHEVFYADGKFKTGLDYAPGNNGACKVLDTVSLDDEMVNAHKNNFSLVYAKYKDVINSFRDVDSTPNTE